MCVCGTSDVFGERYLQDMAKEKALELIEYEPQGSFVSGVA